MVMMADDELTMSDNISLPGTPDSRKRPLDSDSEDVISKRSHYIPDNQSEGTYHLKILVPSIAAGAIIGKGGETIAQLQKDKNARVKMSKANDFYPGTTERVCLIAGNVDSLLSVLYFIMEKIREKPDQNSRNVDFEKASTEREKQVKILVPNSTAGMIIGKGGAYIKQIKEESGAYVQISQKAKDQSLAERCITVNSNDLESSKKACLMIVAKIVEDPQSATCLNVSYADIPGPVANPNPTGSPFATTVSQPSHAGGFSPSNPLSAMGGLGNLLGGGVNLTLNLSSAYPGGGIGNPLFTGQLLEHVRSALRSTGFSESSNAEVCQAINTLINYGIIGLGLGLAGPAQNSQGHSNSLLGPGPGSNDFHASGGSTGPFGPIGTNVSAGLGLGSPHRHVDRFSNENSYDPFRRQSSELGSGGGLLNNSFGLASHVRKNHPSSCSSSGDHSDGTKTVEMEVGEHIVGAILGPGGRSLVEIQNMSNTTIQISKKGNYAPGTRNRIVTITGLSSGISSAQFLMEQRIAEEASKRARQNSVLGP